MNKSDMDLFTTSDVQRYQSEWRTVQAGFVDDPEAAVRDADKLVEEVMDTVASKLKEQRATLTTGDNPDGQRTEQLRIALRHYRTLFQQLTNLSGTDNDHPEPATSTTATPAIAEPTTAKPATVEPTTAEADPPASMNGTDVEHRADLPDTPSSSPEAQPPTGRRPRRGTTN